MAACDSLESRTHSPVVNDLSKNQPSKGWYITAIAVGSLVFLIIGGLGILGLLQSHGLIHLPQALASAVGTIGHTPHLWSLWTMATVGSAVGLGLVSFGAYKLRMEDKKIHNVGEDQGGAIGNKTSNTLPIEQYFINALPAGLTDVGVEECLSNKTFCAIKDRRNNHELFYFVKKDENGKCTQTDSHSEFSNIENIAVALQAAGYKLVSGLNVSELSNEKWGFSTSFDGCQDATTVFQSLKTSEYTIVPRGALLASNNNVDPYIVFVIRDRDNKIKFSRSLITYWYAGEMRELYRILKFQNFLGVDASDFFTDKPWINDFLRNRVGLCFGS